MTELSTYLINNKPYFCQECRDWQRLVIWPPLTNGRIGGHQHIWDGAKKHIYVINMSVW